MSAGRTSSSVVTWTTVDRRKVEKEIPLNQADKAMGAAGIEPPCKSPQVFVPGTHLAGAVLALLTAIPANALAAGALAELLSRRRSCERQILVRWSRAA